MQNLCPCGSGIPDANCCLPIIAGKKDALTALELMRSRYVAFTIANGKYLMNSHSVKTRPIKEEKNIERWAKSVKWLGLKIIRIENGTADDSVGKVEFIASYLESGRIQEIHENSLFCREKNKWVYVSGTQY